MDDFDSRAYRDTMGQYCTGVVIVTGNEDGSLVGFAAQSFVSLSLEPPLVAICPAKTSTSWPRIRATGHFCINVLADDQEDVSEEFAQSGRVADVAWTTNATPAPILKGVMAYVRVHTRRRARCRRPYRRRGSCPRFRDPAARGHPR